jgi:uncharacterized lipoprotein
MWRRTLLLVAVVALTAACGSSSKGKRLYSPDDVKRTFATHGIQLASFTALARAAVGKRFGIRAAFTGPDEDTALRVVVYDRVYRKPPERDTNLCARATSCQRLALVRNVEIFWSSGTKYAPRVRQVIADLEAG